MGLETGWIKFVDITILIWNYPLLTYPKQMEISVCVQFAAKTVQVTSLSCKPCVTIIVKLWIQRYSGDILRAAHHFHCIAMAEQLYLEN